MSDQSEDVKMLKHARKMVNEHEYIDYVWRMRDRRQFGQDIPRRWAYENRKEIHKARLKTKRVMTELEIEQHRIAMEYLSK